LVPLAQQESQAQSGRQVYKVPSVCQVRKELLVCKDQLVRQGRLAQ
jgi:hypothetical protein